MLLTLHLIQVYLAHTCQTNPENKTFVSKSFTVPTFKTDWKYVISTLAICQAHKRVPIRDFTLKIHMYIYITKKEKKKAKKKQKTP